MIESEYRTRPALGSTALRALIRSPLHYFSQYECDESERLVVEPSPAMHLGTCVHMAILEPGRWATSHAVAPRVDRRTKAGKERWSSFLEESRGKLVVKPAELGLIEGMRSAVRRHSAAEHVLRLAEDREASFFWTAPESGVSCKGRADALGGGLLVDLKTCQSAAPGAFQRDIARHGYHHQAAHYIEGARVALGAATHAFAWVAVESAPPHAVSVYVADAEMIERADHDRKVALDVLCDCRASGYWPAYSDRIETISLPAWA